MSDFDLFFKALSAFQPTDLAPAGISKKHARALFNALTPEQQALVKSIAEQAARNGQRVHDLEGVVLHLSSSLETVSSHDDVKDHEIRTLRSELAVLTRQIMALASSSGIQPTNHPLPPPLPSRASKGATHTQIDRTPRALVLKVATQEMNLLVDFVGYLKTNDTLLAMLKANLKGDKSTSKKFVAATVENWLIEHKKPSGISLGQWKALVHDSIADFNNDMLAQFHVPNLHHFIDKQYMRIRSSLLIKN